MTSPTNLGFPGAADAIAASNGVERFVVVSERGEPEAARTERALTGHSSDWTVLRSSWFAQNFSEYLLLGDAS